MQDTISTAVLVEAVNTADAVAAPAFGGAVQRAVCAHPQRGLGKCPILRGTALEVMQNTISASVLEQLEDRSEIVAAAPVGGAVKGPIGVLDERTHGNDALNAQAEASHDGITGTVL